MLQAQNSAKLQEATPLPKSVETDNLFGYELERLYGSINRLEGFGHRLVDTNEPVKDSTAEGVSPSRIGILPNIHNKVSELTRLNDRFNRILAKLDELA